MSPILNFNIDGLHSDNNSIDIDDKNTIDIIEKIEDVIHRITHIQQLCNVDLGPRGYKVRDVKFKEPRYLIDCNVLTSVNAMLVAAKRMLEISRDVRRI